MRKSILALATGAVLAAATLTPTTADARCRGCGIAAGLLGGLAAGAIIGSAVAGPPVYAAPGPVYVEEAPVYVRPGRCYAEEEYWSPRRQAYVVRSVRVPCY